MLKLSNLKDLFGKDISSLDQENNGLDIIDGTGEKKTNPDIVKKMAALGTMVAIMRGISGIDAQARNIGVQSRGQGISIRMEGEIQNINEHYQNIVKQVKICQEVPVTKYKIIKTQTQNKNTNSIGLDTIIGGVAGVAIGNQFHGEKDAARVIGGIGGALFANHIRSNGTTTTKQPYTVNETHCKVQNINQKELAGYYANVKLSNGQTTQVYIPKSNSIQPSDLGVGSKITVQLSGKPYQISTNDIQQQHGNGYNPAYNSERRTNGKGSVASSNPWPMEDLDDAFGRPY